MPAQNKLVVVTGAGSGIGRAIAFRYAAHGATAIVTDINEPTAQETVSMIRADGGTAHAYRLDVTDPQGWELFATQLADDHGVPDVLVNNAGFGVAGSFLEQSAGDWERIFAVNVMGIVNGSRVMANAMIAAGKRGHITNISSGMAWIPNMLAPSYSVTKAAALMASECIRIELAGKGIGVTAICPGVIGQTNILSHAERAETSSNLDGLLEVSGGMAANYPIGPDRVAKAVLRAERFNPAVLPVNPEAWLVYLLHRLSPGLIRTAARLVNPKAATAVSDTVLPTIARGLRRIGRRRTQTPPDSALFTIYDDSVEPVAHEPNSKISTPPVDAGPTAPRT